MERCHTEGSTKEGNFGGKLWGRAFGGEREIADIPNVNRLSRPSLLHKGIRESGGLVPLTLDPTLDEDEYSASRPGRLAQEERFSLPIGGWVAPRVGLDALEREEKSVSYVRNWTTISRLSCP